MRNCDQLYTYHAVGGHETGKRRLRHQPCAHPCVQSTSALDSLTVHGSIYALLYTARYQRTLASGTPTSRHADLIIYLVFPKKPTSRSSCASTHMGHWLYTACSASTILLRCLSYLMIPISISPPRCFLAALLLALVSVSVMMAMIYFRAIQYKASSIQTWLSGSMTCRNCS